MTCTTKTPKNGQQEPCGCGTAAEIAYLGHKSTCEWNSNGYMREVPMRCCWLFLKKRKKVTLFENFQQQHKRPRLQSPSDLGTKEEITKDTKTDLNMDNSSTPQLLQQVHLHY